uniref:Dynamin family protein n=1 Tax=Draparnaldia mutabilis TaxID=1683230 RepID=A0A6H1U883_9CHLO|nr:Dynamin family protein [Draparnaldia mutabilis]
MVPIKTKPSKISSKLFNVLPNIEGETSTSLPPKRFPRFSINAINLSSSSGPELSIVSFKACCIAKYSDRPSKVSPIRSLLSLKEREASNCNKLRLLEFFSKGK